MPNTPTTRIRIPKPADGDGNWGVPWRKQMDRLDEAIAGMATIALSDADTILTTDNEETDQTRQAILKFTGTLTAQRNITIPAVSKIYHVWNAASQSLQIKTAAGAGVIVPSGVRVVVFCDGTDCFYSNPSLLHAGNLVVGVKDEGVYLPRQLVAEGTLYAVVTNPGIGAVSFGPGTKHERVFEAPGPGANYMVSYTPGRMRTENMNLGQAGLGFRLGATSFSTGGRFSTWNPLVTQTHLFAIPFAQQSPMPQNGGMPSYNAGPGAGFSWLMGTGGFCAFVLVGSGQRLSIGISGEWTSGSLLMDQCQDRIGIWKLTAN